LVNEQFCKQGILRSEAAYVNGLAVKALARWSKELLLMMGTTLLACTYAAPQYSEGMYFTIIMPISRF
jgi:hypothetical protein